MSSWLRSLLITFIVTAFSFLTLTAWYWMNFKEPATEKIYLLRQVMPAVEQLLEAHDDPQAANLLDKVPFKVVVTDTAKHVIISNIAKTPRQRRDLGLQALQSKGLQNFLINQESYLRFYYQEPLEIWDLNLLFLLIFGLLLGLIATLWDYLQRMHLENQTDTLVYLSQQHRDNTDDDDDEEFLALEAEHKQLKAALKAAQEKLSQTDIQIKKDQDNLALQNTLSKVQKSYQSAQHTIKELEQSLESTQAEALIWQNKEQLFAQKELEQEQEITRLHQEQQSLNRELEQAQKRLESGEHDSAQLHETWQEIERLRRAEMDLLKREELWQKEKQRVLGLMHEKEEQSEVLKQRLTSARQKIRALSVAYKKVLESNLNLPEDLIEFKEILDGLIEEKDLIEQENVNLRIDLADKESETRRLKTELGIRAERLEQAKRMIDELSQNLHKNERELGLLSETLDDKMHDLERVKSLHSEEQQILEEMTQERDSLRIRLSDSESEIEELKTLSNSLRFEKEQLEQQVESVDLPAYALEIEQLKQSLHLMNLQQQRRSQTVETLKSKLKEGEEIYKRLKRHTEAQEQELRNLQQDMGRYRSEMLLMEKKLGQQDQSKG